MRPPPQQDSTTVLVLKVLFAVFGSLGALVAVAWLLFPGLIRLKDSDTVPRVERQTSARTGELTMSERIALTKLGNDLVDSIRRGSGLFVLQCVDNESLVDRALAPLPPPLKTERLRQEILRALAAGSSESEGGWLRELLGSNVAFVRIAEQDGVPQVILRLLPEGGGVTYLGLVVSRVPGEPRIIDCYSYCSGIYHSSQLGERLALLHSDAEPTLLGRVFGHAELNAQTLAIFTDIHAAWTQKNYDRVLSLCESLPARHQTNKNLYSIKLEALGRLWQSSKSREKDYRELLKQAPSILGPDAVTDLYLAELLMLDKSFPEAEAAVKRAEKVIGVDGYLKMLLAKLRLLQGDVNAAEQLLRAAKIADSRLEELTHLELHLLMLRRDYAAMMQVIDYFERWHGKKFDRTFFTDDPTFADFVASPPYQSWLVRNPMHMPSLLQQLRR